VREGPARGELGIIGHVEDQTVHKNAQTGSALAAASDAARQGRRGRARDAVPKCARQLAPLIVAPATHRNWR
jgi:hypothetical protein